MTARDLRRAGNSEDRGLCWDVFVVLGHVECNGVLEVCLIS